METHTYRYQSDFFDFVDRSSGRSAKAFLGRIKSDFSVQSVLDVGCGRGVWLKAWKALGVQDVKGVDGEYVDCTRLHVERAEFQALDISSPFSLGRRFDVVQCLEVAEHVPAVRSAVLIDNLVSHGDLILFSAAIPGQGGEHHVNEQPLAYWVAKFKARGYRAYDFVRERVRAVPDIEPWYRYNSLVFATNVGAKRLGAHAFEKIVSDNADLMGTVPLAWKIRCATLSALPTRTIDALAKIKHRFAR